MSFKIMTSGNKKIVADFIEKVLNTGNTDRIADYIAPGYVEIFENRRHELGIEGARAHVEGVRNTYPDLTLTIDMQISEGDYVVTCYTMRGTHKGEWMGIAPTGRTVEITGVDVDKVVFGRIVEHGGAANVMHAFLDIGALVIPGKESGPKG